jgi:hypothetical protein
VVVVVRARDDASCIGMVPSIKMISLDAPSIGASGRSSFHQEALCVSSDPAHRRTMKSMHRDDHSGRHAPHGTLTRGVQISRKRFDPPAGMFVPDQERSRRPLAAQLFLEATMCRHLRRCGRVLDAGPIAPERSGRFPQTLTRATGHTRTL